MEDNQNEIEAINREIEKYTAQAKKVKKVVPLVTFVSVMMGYFLLKDIQKYTSISALGLGSVLLFISTFAYTYFKSIYKVKKLNSHLENLQN